MSPIKRTEIIGDCVLHLGDCLEVMPLVGSVDALVTDPPYGIDFGNFNRTNKAANGERYKANKYENGDWDKNFDLRPFVPEFFKKTEKIIVWGGNYFPVLWEKPAKGIIFWYKHQPVRNFSDGELAWTNLDTPAKHIDFPYYGNIEGRTSASEKQHPTQKPVEVMKQCVEFTKTTGAILDPFMGSGTTGVACVKLGRKFIGIELNEQYFDIACERIRKAYAQPDMFISAPAPKPVQETMF